MNNNYSIFKKKIDEDKLIISKDEIMSAIPEKSLQMENKELSLYNKEWRWRIFKFPTIENEIIEISYKEPNEKRFFITQNNKWININEEQLKQYDKFVIKTYYNYDMK